MFFERGALLKMITFLAYPSSWPSWLRVESSYSPSHAVSQSMVSHEGTKTTKRLPQLTLFQIGQAVRKERFGETLV